MPQSLCVDNGRSKQEQKAAETEKMALDKLMAELENGRSARSVTLSSEEREEVEKLNLLTMKPMIYAANINEDDLSDNGVHNDNIKVQSVAKFNTLRKLL